MRTLVIEKKTVQANAKEVLNRARSATVYGVLAGDGLGVGLTGLAQLLNECGIEHFAVGEVDEVRRLREGGFERQEILMLRTVHDEGQLEELLHLNAVCTANSYESAALLNSVAARLGTVAEVQLKVDCGLGFGGFFPDEARPVISVFQTLSNLAVVGMYTELQSEGRAVSIQLDQFKQLASALRNAGHSPGILHAAGSSLLMEEGTLGLDAVRVGTAFLGRSRRDRKNLLRPVGYGMTQIEELRWLGKGRTVGTQAEITLDKPTQVAIIPVGWQNGLGLDLRRQGENRGVISKLISPKKLSVTIHRKRVPVISAPGGMETMLDVTGLNCKVGDRVTFELDPLLAKGFERVFI